MKTLPPEDLHIGQLIEHPLLGKFMVVARRVAEVGDYYVCKIVPGIGLALKASSSSRWILEKV